jgi:hypothetical protein
MNGRYERTSDVSVKIETRRFQGQVQFQYRISADYIDPTDGTRMHRRTTAYSIEELNTIVATF